MEQKLYYTDSAKETEEIAFNLFSDISQSQVVFLSGDIGAGKTHFTKGIARAIGVKEVVNSPSFTILKEYEGNKFNLKHIDAYRLNEKIIDSLGFFDLINKENIVVIEWPENIKSMEIDCDTWIKINYLDDHKRSIEVQSC